MARDLVKDAVKDAQALKRAALDAAKNELIEAMTPQLKALLEGHVKTVFGQSSEGVNRMRRVEQDYPGESKTNFEESADKGEESMDKDKQKDLEAESIESFFPQLGLAEMDEVKYPNEAADDELAAACPAPEGEKEKEEESFIPTLGEAEEGDMDEDIEISEAELLKVYEQALQTEATVTKSFGEMSKSGELDEVDPGAGIVDVKKGEHSWEKETPPAKQDWTVKEMIQMGRAENRKLREQLGKAVGVIKHLNAQLHEVNLFNSKVLHVNRILNTQGRLTKEQKRVVLEAIDKAKTLEQVSMVYEAIVSSFNAVQMNESRSRKPLANAQRARSTSAPDRKVLGESVDRAETSKYSRLQELAGLVNK